MGIRDRKPKKSLTLLLLGSLLLLKSHFGIMVIGRSYLFPFIAASRLSQVINQDKLLPQL